MEHPKSEREKQEEHKAEERVTEHRAKIEAARLRVQRFEDQLRPVTDLLAKRQAELAVAQRVIDHVTYATDPSTLMAAQVSRAGLAPIVDLAQREFQEIDVQRKRAQDDLMTLTRMLPASKGKNDVRRTQ